MAFQAVASAAVVRTVSADGAGVLVRLEWTASSAGSALVLTERLPAGSSVASVSSGGRVEAQRQDGSSFSFVVSRAAAAAGGAFSYVASVPAGVPFSVGGSWSELSGWVATKTGETSGDAALTVPASGGEGVDPANFAIRGLSVDRAASGGSVVTLRWTGSGDRDVIVQRADGFAAAASSPAAGALKGAAQRWRTVATVKADDSAIAAAAGVEASTKAASGAAATRREFAWTFETEGDSGFFRLVVDDGAED